MGRNVDEDSGAPWDVKYAYFVKGWVNNWGWGAHDGSMATSFFTSPPSGGSFRPLEFYQMKRQTGGGEGQFFPKTQNAATMATYFRQFQLS